MSKFLTDSKRLNIAIILFAIVNIYGIYWGTLYALAGTLMSYHETAIGMTSSQISNYNPRLMNFIGAVLRMEGTCSIVWSITNLYILRYSFRNKEKWSWKVFLGTGLFYRVIMLIVVYFILGPLTSSFILNCIVFSFLIIALGISYKEFFK